MGHGTLDFEATDKAFQTALVDFLLNGNEQVIRFVLQYRKVCIAGNTKDMVIRDGHAGKQVVQILGNHLLQRHSQPETAFPFVTPQRFRHCYEPGQAAGHLDAGKALVAVFWIHHPHRQVQT